MKVAETLSALVFLEKHAEEPAKWHLRRVVETIAAEWTGVLPDEVKQAIGTPENTSSGGGTPLRPKPPAKPPVIVPQGDE